MPKYSFTAENLTDTLTPGEVTSARGTLSAPSPEAAREAVEKSLRSRAYEPTGSVTVTPK
ncbi:hypothetical protein ACIA78_17610 [Streptomyces xanthochromogenes]|uniref:hypothetical protein n=1 Tax=Streptomyces xanthochromogenes TaxID=67384 RepID=UPI00379054A8